MRDSIYAIARYHPSVCLVVHLSHGDQSKTVEVSIMQISPQCTENSPVNLVSSWLITSLWNSKGNIGSRPAGVPN